MDKQIDIRIIGGFLGSGKTTLLNRRLANLPADKKAALIINEFGEISIDGMLIEKESYSLMEIMGGCVCCTLKVQLLEGLLDIIRTEEPDEIYIEATGMAVPWEMKEAIEAGLSAEGIGTVSEVTVCVDGKQYKKAAGKLPIYDLQFQGTPDILLTKGDIYDPSLLAEVAADIKQRFPAGRAILEGPPPGGIIQMTFTSLTGPTAGELTSLISGSAGYIIRAKGIVAAGEENKGEVLQYDGNRIEIIQHSNLKSSMNSLILFCKPGSRDKLFPLFAPLYG